MRLGSRPVGRHPDGEQHPAAARRMAAALPARLRGGRARRRAQPPRYRRRLPRPRRRSGHPGRRHEPRDRLLRELRRRDRTIAELPAARGLHARWRRRPLAHRVQAGETNGPPRRPERSASRSQRRCEELLAARDAGRRLARVRLLHAQRTECEPRRERQRRSSASAGAAYRCSSRPTSRSRPSRPSSRCTRSARGCDELPEPLAPHRSTRSPAGGRPLPARRTAPAAVRGALHEHGGARVGRPRVRLAAIRAGGRVPAGAGRALLGDREARAQHARARGAGDGDPRHRRLPLDAGARRQADAARRREEGAPNLHRPGSRPAA